MPAEGPREILDRVRSKKETVIIQNYATPQAVIIPYEDYDEFLAWRSAKEKRAAWLAELQRIAEGVTASAALSEEKAQYLVDEEVDKTRDCNIPNYNAITTPKLACVLYPWSPR